MHISFFDGGKTSVYTHIFSYGIGYTVHSAPAALKPFSLHTTNTGQWFIPAGQSVLQDNEDVSALETAIYGSVQIRLDGENNGGGLLALMESGVPVNGTTAYETLKSAHQAMARIIEADILPTGHQKHYGMAMARALNSGHPVQIAETLAYCAVQIRRPMDQIYATLFTILYRRAINHMARLNAITFDAPLDETLNVLRRALPVNGTLTSDMRILFPYNSRRAVQAPAYTEEKHGIFPIAQKQELAWFSVNERPQKKRQPYVVVETGQGLSADSFALLKHLHGNAGQFVTREKLHKTLFRDSGNPEARLNVAIKAARDAIGAVTAKTGQKPDTILMSRHGIGLRLLHPGESWTPPVKAKVKKEIIARVAAPKPVPQTTLHDFGYFSIEQDKNSKRFGLKFTGRHRFLTATEFALLQHLSMHAGAWVSVSDISSRFFEQNKNSCARASKLIHDLAERIQEGIGKEKADLAMRIHRGAGICLAKPGIDFTPVPEKTSARRSFTRAARPTQTVDFGSFKMLVHQGAKRNPVTFEGTDVAVSQSEYELLCHLHARKGMWVSTKALQTLLFPLDKYASSRVLTLAYGLRKKITAALGERGAGVFAMARYSGLVMADGDNPIPPAPHGRGGALAVPRAIQMASAQTSSNMPEIYYHQTYGPGYRLGSVTRAVGGTELTFERFMPLTVKEPREQTEVLLAENQLRKGYGPMNMEAFRLSLRAGAHTLRQSIESNTYDGPPPAAVGQALAADRAPSHLVPMLAAFAFHVPQSRDGSAAVHAQLEKSVIRCITLAYPHITQLQAQRHLKILQTASIRIPMDLVWTFDSAQAYSEATAKLDALIKNAAKKKNGRATQLGEFAFAVEGKRRTGNGQPVFDMRAYLDRRTANTAPERLVVN